MKKNQIIASDAKGKTILQTALNSSENEHLDLYKAIFGGSGSDCPIIAVSDSDGQASAYDKSDQVFLRV